MWDRCEWAGKDDARRIRKLSICDKVQGVCWLDAVGDLECWPLGGPGESGKEALGH